MAKIDDQLKELGEEMKGLIDETEKWCLEIGAYRNEEGVIQDFFTVDDWCENFTETKGVFRVLKLCARKLGTPIIRKGYPPGNNGHYLGTIADLGESSAEDANHAMTRLSRVKVELEIDALTGNLNETIKRFGAKSRVRDKRLKKLLQIVTEIVEESGEPRQMSFGEVMLQDYLDSGDNE